jgi:biotin/methionine sulfoxide reductase
VSWDHAIRLVAEETARVRSEHGDASIYGGSYGWSSAGRFHHAKSQLQRFLGMGGGYSFSVNAYSYATAQALMPHLMGTNEVFLGRMTDWAAIAGNAKLMLCFGGLAAKNGYVTSGGAANTYGPNMRAAVAAGVVIVNISPYRADTEDALAAEFVPIRPTTDTALILAMIQHIVSLGREDRAFLRTHCVGWDRAGADARRTRRPNGPKASPASRRHHPRAGRALPRPADHAHRLLVAPACRLHGEQPYWALVALASMLGNIGKPGQGRRLRLWLLNGMGNPRKDLPRHLHAGLAQPGRHLHPRGAASPNCWNGRAAPCSTTAAT